MVQHLSLRTNWYPFIDNRLSEMFDQEKFHINQKYQGHFLKLALFVVHLILVTDALHLDLIYEDLSC